MSQTLVAWFSATGETARAAGALARAAQADRYEIRPAQPYTAADLNWRDGRSRSSVEMRNPACRPALAGALPDLSRYDTVFVGFPIWWYEAPRIIETFLESGDFSGKTLIPFCTSGGSGLGRTGEILAAVTGGAVRWRRGARLSSPTRPEEIAALLAQAGPNA